MNFHFFLIALFFCTHFAEADKAFTLTASPQGKLYGYSNSTISLIPKYFSNTPYPYKIPTQVVIQEIRFARTIQWGFRVPGENYFFIPQDQEYFKKIYSLPTRTTLQSQARSKNKIQSHKEKSSSPPKATRPASTKITQKKAQGTNSESKKTKTKPAPSIPAEENYSFDDCASGNLKKFNSRPDNIKPNNTLDDLSYFSSCTAYSVCDGLSDLINSTIETPEPLKMLPEYYFLSAIEKSISTPGELKNRITRYHENHGFFERGLLTADSLYSTMNDIKQSREIVVPSSEFDSKAAQMILQALDEKIKTLYAIAYNAHPGTDNLEKIPFFDKDGIKMSLENRVKRLIAETKEEIAHKAKKVSLPSEAISEMNMLTLHSSNTISKRDRLFCDTRSLKRNFLHLICHKHPVIVGEVLGFETEYEKHSLLLTGYHVDKEGSLFFDFKNPDPKKPTVSIHEDSLCDIGSAFVPYLNPLGLKNLIAPKQTIKTGPLPSKAPMAHEGINGT